jgi:hypothetical protein
MSKACLNRALSLHLARENEQLRNKKRLLEAELSICIEEKAWMMKEHKTLGGMEELKGRLKVLQKGILTMRTLRDVREREAEAKAGLLGRCLRRQNPGLVHRLAKIADLGLRKRRFTPKRLIRDIGWDYALGYHCITLLWRMGVFRREKHGRYAADPGMGRENLEEEIARRLAMYAGEKGVQDNP